MIAAEHLKKTPLFDRHVALKAKMVPFGGWEMPVQYEGILAEYEQTRRRTTVFDTSHMGEFHIEGDLVKSGLDRIVTMSLADLPVKTCRYGVILNDHAGVIDDLIVFRLEDKKWFIVVNGSTIEKDAQHFQKYLTREARFTNISFETGKIDLQGPLAREILKRFIPQVPKLDYYAFDFFDLFGENVLVSRTGYTGELGYEIFYPWAKISKVWDRLLEDDRVRPAGLGARDMLRLEVGYSLYGHELEENINPLEAGLSRFVDLQKDFIGKQALLAQKQNGHYKTIAYCVSSSRKSPRAGHTFYDAYHQPLGYVTSGTFSPAVNAGVGIGFLEKEQNILENKIFFGDDKSKIECQITRRPFYKDGSLKY